MEREQLLEMLQQLYLVCQQINADIQATDPNNTLIYEVLQLSDFAKPRPGEQKKSKPITAEKIVRYVANFYNKNWEGNADFMHIPNYEQVMANIMKYPIIIARERGKSEILAISTIKYDENTTDCIDPYFPMPNAKYFSITGILARKNAPYRGMGKKIYEIALRGACGYAQNHPETRMMCVIDSRNSPSLRALSTAVETINAQESVGIGKGLPAHVVGYYELKGEEGNLKEAPTLVLEVGLEPITKSLLSQQGANLDFSLPEDGSSLFSALQQELKSKFMKFGIQDPIVLEDKGEGTVLFHSFTGECNISKTLIAANGTEKGNNRTPWAKDPTRHFHGPVITYFKEMDYDDEPEL